MDVDVGINNDNDIDENNTEEESEFTCCDNVPRLEEMSDLTFAYDYELLVKSFLVDPPMLIDLMNAEMVLRLFWEL